MSKRCCVLNPAFVWCLVLLCGCSKSVPSQFYLLTPQAEQVPLQEMSDESAPLVGLGPIGLPGYLKHNQILTRKGENELQLSEVHQWAEPLDESFSLVLSRNLSRLTKSKRFVEFPWFLDIEVDIRVVVRVIEFDGALGGEAKLAAAWLVYPAENLDMNNLRVSHFVIPVGGSGYNDLAAAMSEAVYKLSQEIAVEIGRVHGN